ncbi:MAG: acylphosphatase, partial [Acidimicrobiia bacterium]
DGTVQTWAQGSRDAVDRFLGFLEEGPPAARVTEVNAAAVPPDLDLTGFGVRY